MTNFLNSQSIATNLIGQYYNISIVLEKELLVKHNAYIKFVMRADYSET